MGSLFSRSKRLRSRVTEQDKAILQLKQQRDRLKQYQKRIELNMESDRQLAKKCLANGRKERAKSLLRKKKFQETLLINTDKQLENLETLAANIEFAQVEYQVINGLKQGNEALKKMHEILDLSDVEKIIDETHEGIEKQMQIDSFLKEALTEQDEEDVLKELNDLVAEEIEQVDIKLPEVPHEELPNVQEGENEEMDDVEQIMTNEKSAKVKRQRLLVEL